MTHLGGTHTRKSSVFKHYGYQLNGDDFAQNSCKCLPTGMLGAISKVPKSSDTFRWHSYKKKFGICPPKIGLRPIFVRAALELVFLLLRNRKSMLTSDWQSFQQPDFFKY